MLSSKNPNTLLRRSNRRTCGSRRWASPANSPASTTLAPANTAATGTEPDDEPETMRTSSVTAKTAPSVTGHQRRPPSRAPAAPSPATAEHVTTSPGEYRTSIANAAAATRAAV